MARGSLRPGTPAAQIPPVRSPTTARGAGTAPGNGVHVIALPFFCRVNVVAESGLDSVNVAKDLSAPVIATWPVLGSRAEAKIAVDDVYTALVSVLREGA